MVERVFQYIDPEGKPNGGMVFRAPDEATLGTLILMTQLAPGWTMVEVESSDDVITEKVVTNG
jgi:hypothetical protein